MKTATRFMLTSATLLVLCTGNVQAKLYKWVDENGVTHYGETIPPEYANRDREQLNKQGLVEKREKVINAEERKASAEAKSRKQAEALAQQESKRRDNALLDTYTTEKEIDLARDRNLQQIEARINSNITLLQSAQANLSELQKERDNLNQQKRPIPPSLLEEIKAKEERIAKLQKELELGQQKMAAVKSRFEADKQRFRELKGLR